MKNSESTIIRVRYGIIPIIGILMIACIFAAFSPFIGVFIIILITLPLLAAICVRLFLLVTQTDVRYVSLISNHNFRSTTHEEPDHNLPAMRWFLRRSDLDLLTTQLHSIRG